MKSQDKIGNTLGIPEKNIKINVTGGSTIRPKPFGAFIEAGDMVAYNNQIMGEVLTLIESSIPEGKQQTALKSLIKQSFWRNYDLVWQWMNKIERIKEGEKEGSGSKYPDFPLVNFGSIE